MKFRQIFSSYLYSKHMSMSDNQIKIYNHLLQNKQIQEKKQLNLIAQLVQKLKPLLEPYKYVIVDYIQNEQIKSNLDLDYAIKILYQQIKLGLDTHNSIDEFVKLYNSNIHKQRITQEIIQLQKECGCDCQILLNTLEKNHPELQKQILEEVIAKHFDKQSCHQHIYQRIQTFTPREIPDQKNNYNTLQRHLEQTHGQIVLRFPPEPNGCLHLGHVRSIRLNFYSAEQLHGQCYLRYDDTNPVAEKQQFIDEIQENVKWFGHQPSHITYASDYFDLLYDSAIKLIKKNQAYICEQTKEEMHQFRKLKIPSPYRERDINENLYIFQQMQQGVYPENKYTLRLKIDYAHNNPTLRDPVIYRVLYHPHPRTGNKWKVYPMYDFAHCICDSIENITHSLCTLEFEIRRELYYWILNNLDMFKPLVYEFSRLNVSQNMLSKRRILKMIQLGIVSGWDDPRLLTLSGLKRRGYTPSAINSFIDQVSVPRHGNEHIISIRLLENCQRKELESSVPKIMAIVDPVRCRIINYRIQEPLELMLNSNNKGLGSRLIRYSDIIYLERKDIKLQDDNDFYGIAPKKRVSLKYFGLFECVRIYTENDEIAGVDLELISTELQDRKGVKGQLHWIAEEDSKEVTINEYEDLFTIANPAECENYLDYVNKNSLRVFQRSRVPLMSFLQGERYQFERMGFYIVENDRMFNKIVGMSK